VINPLLQKGGTKGDFSAVNPCINYNHFKKKLRRINDLLKDIERNGYNGRGKPEPLRNDLSGWWSVRIDDVSRLVFCIEGDAAHGKRLNGVVQFVRSA
jgi:Txe/YoeB family toxin of toxin-antitoxin system